MMLFVAAFAINAAAAPPDFRRQWTCDSRSQFDGISTTVIRTLDANGAQFDVNVQWNIAPRRMFTASVFATAHAEGAGDPALRLGTVLASWSGRYAEGANTTGALAVLHSVEQPPRRADGRKLIDRSDKSFSVEVPWTRVSALSRGADRAKISVTNTKGEVIQSAGVELRQIRRALAAVEEGLAETRWQMGDFKERCSAITEWLTF